VCIWQGGKKKNRRVGEVRMDAMAMCSDMHAARR
jgi:hypothetical protein